MSDERTPRENAQQIAREAAMRVLFYMQHKVPLVIRSGEDQQRARFRAGLALGRETRREGEDERTGDPR